MHAFLLWQASECSLNDLSAYFPEEKGRKGGRDWGEENRWEVSHNTSACQIERNMGACSRDHDVGHREKLQFFSSPTSRGKTASAIFSGKLAFAEEASVLETQIYYGAKLTRVDVGLFRPGNAGSPREKFPADMYRSLLTSSFRWTREYFYIPEMSSYCVFRYPAIIIDRFKRNFTLHKQNKIIKSRALLLLLFPRCSRG